MLRRRAGWLAAAALALVVLSACGGADPVLSPSPTPPVESPSPVPTVTTDADGRALPGFVTVSADLPPAQPAQNGLLAQTSHGWSLQTYRPQVEPVTNLDGVTPGFAATVQVVYAVSPDGKRYQLLELDPAKPIVIDSWTAGESVAYVRQCDPLDCPPTTPTELLDLLTGEFRPVGSDAAQMRIGATIAGSHRWWQDGSTQSALETAGNFTTSAESWLADSASPDGAYLAVVRGDEYSPYVTAGVGIVDVATGRLTDVATLWTEPLKCTPFRWRADDALDLSCYDPARATWRVFTVGPGAQEMKENKSATATPPATGPWVEPDFFVTDGVWAGPFTADAAERLAPDSSTIGLARNAGFEQLSVPDATVGTARIVGSVAGVLYVEATQANNLSLTTAWALRRGHVNVDVARRTTPCWANARPGRHAGLPRSGPHVVGDRAVTEPLDPMPGSAEPEGFATSIPHEAAAGQRGVAVAQPAVRRLAHGRDGGRCWRRDRAGCHPDHRGDIPGSDRIPDWSVGDG